MILTRVVVLAFAATYIVSGPGATHVVSGPAATYVVSGISRTVSYLVSGFSRTVSVESESSAKAVSRTVSAAPQAARTTNNAVFTAEQAKRGEVLYQFICAPCHGAALAGIEAAPPLAGTTFSASWSGAPVGDLFERIRISMPQDKPGSLGRQQAADVVAYILSFNKAPAGQTELPGDAEVLKTITIIAAN